MSYLIIDLHFATSSNVEIYKYVNCLQYLSHTSPALFLDVKEMIIESSSYL